MAIIHLNNTTVMYLKEVTKFLALVCFLREESFERKGLIDYNFHCFKNAIQEVFDVRVKVQKNRKLLSQRRWSKQAPMESLAASTERRPIGGITCQSTIFKST